MDKYIIGVNLGTKVVTILDMETKELTWTKIAELSELIIGGKINIVKNHIMDGEAVDRIPNYFSYAISTANPYLHNEQYALISVESSPELGKNMVKVRFSDIKGNIQEKTVNKKRYEQLNIRGYDLIFDDEDFGRALIAMGETGNIDRAARDFGRERILKWVGELIGKESTYGIENRQRSIVKEIKDCNTSAEKRSKLNEELKELDMVRYKQREEMIEKAPAIDKYSRQKYLEAIIRDFRISSDECREINKAIIEAEWEIKEVGRKQMGKEERQWIEYREKEEERQQTERRERAERQQQEHLVRIREKAERQLSGHMSKNSEVAERQLMEHQKIDFDALSEDEKEAYFHTLEKKSTIQEEREKYKKTVSMLTHKIQKFGATESDVRMTIDAVKEMHPNPAEQREAIIRELTEWHDRLKAIKKTKQSKAI